MFCGGFGCFGGESSGGAETLTDPLMVEGGTWKGLSGFQRSRPDPCQDWSSVLPRFFLLEESGLTQAVWALVPFLPSGGS